MKKLSCWQSLDYRFWSRINKTETCWLWLGKPTSHGYGAIRANGERISTHRFSWEIHNGPIPDGLFVCHKCDVKLCVNPDHLFLGTNLDNQRDRAHKGIAGWKLSIADVKAIRDRLAAGDNQYQIASDFGVYQSLISKINTGELWNQVRPQMERICDGSHRKD